MVRESRKMRAKQVGMLMRAYRLDYSSEDQGGKLSQTALIELMAEENGIYHEKYDHSTVSRWERGITLPTPEHLEVFGRALKLLPAEIDGLRRLAGLDEENGDTPSGIQSIEETSSASQVSMAYAPEYLTTESGTEPGTVASAEFGSFDKRVALRYVVSHFLMPGSCIALAGYILASNDWSAPLLLGLFVGIALCLVTLQSFLRMRRANSLQELFFVTVFFQLSVQLLHGPLTYMDSYGLYAVGDFAGTTIPFTLSLIANLFIALVAALMFAFLAKWQYSDPLRGGNPIGRAAWIVLPPLGIVYACVVAFSYIGFWILALCIFLISAGVFATLIALRDESVRIGEWDRKFLLCVAVALTIVLATVGVAGALVTFLEPSLLATSGDTMFNSLENDLHALGYSADEFMERYRHAILLGSLVSLTYMVFVVGGKLIVTIYKLGGGDTPGRAMSAGMAQVAAAVRQPSALRSRLDARYWLRLLRRRGKLSPQGA